MSDERSPHAWPPPLGQAQRRPAASPNTHSSRVRRLAAGAGVALVGVVGGVTLIKVLPSFSIGSDHSDDGGAFSRGDHDDHRNSDFGGAPQPGRPGTQSQSSSGSS